jgi:transposase
MQTQVNKLDFTGQHIFVGLDIGKKSWKTSIFTQQFEHKTFTQPPKAEVLSKYLKRNFPGAIYHCVYESGYFGFWIYDELLKHGLNCIVVNPADVPTKHKEKRRKTNRVDARKLARNLRSGEVEPLYIPPKIAREDRSLVRSRYYFIKKQTRCKNQIKALLCFYGISIPEGLGQKHWSKRFINWLSEVQKNLGNGCFSMKALLAELVSLRHIIADLNKQIRTLAQEERYRVNVKNLVSIPGISTISAMIILTELITIHRFSTIDDIAGYVGLVPDEDSTGEEKNIIGLTYRCNSFLRHILIEASWIAVRNDPALTMAYNKLSKRMIKKRAIIRIARKLLNRIRFVLKNQLPYVNLVIQTKK